MPSCETLLVGPLLCDPLPPIFSATHTAVRAFSNFKSDMLPGTWNHVMVSDPSSKVLPWQQCLLDWHGQLSLASAYCPPHPRLPWIVFIGSDLLPPGSPLPCLLAVGNNNASCHLYRALAMLSTPGLLSSLSHGSEIL